MAPYLEGQMVTHDLVQGSPEWHKFRLEHHGASEAAAMMGLSKYVTRNELLLQKKTGIAKVIDSATQFIFDKGHEVERLARPIIETEIGDDLYQAVVSVGRLSASLDGMTMDGETVWECKQFNASLYQSIHDGELPREYWPQCQQILMLTGSKKLIFTVSDGTRERTVSMNIFPYVLWFGMLIAGWEQFDKDIETFVPIEIIDAPLPTPTKDLPALAIKVEGTISIISNLHRWGEKLAEFISNIPTLDSVSTDDQAFADCENAIKVLQRAEDLLKVAESNAIAQTADIDEMRCTVKLHVDTARTTRLMLEKLVKARKESIRVDIVKHERGLAQKHLDSLNARHDVPYLSMWEIDFSSAIKGKRTVKSVREAVGIELMKFKLEANKRADDIDNNLRILREKTGDYKFLFSDVKELISLEEDHLLMVVKTRINEYIQREADKVEALRKKIQAEEEAKAAAAQAAELQSKLAEEKAKWDAEAAEAAAVQRRAQEAAAKLHQEATKKAQEAITRDAGIVPPSDPVKRTMDVYIESAKEKPSTVAKANSGEGKHLVTAPQFPRPTDKEILMTLKLEFCAPEAIIIGWLRDFDFEKIN